MQLNYLLVVLVVNDVSDVNVMSSTVAVICVVNDVSDVNVMSSTVAVIYAVIFTCCPCCE